jgi:aryl-alcohol dehydrogenase-like predicted oxidoreductase
MEYRQIGPLRVSTVGLGCNNFARRLDPDASASVVEAALDAGINFFDTADRYGYGEHAYSGYGQSEVLLGSALRRHRDQVVIATKFGNPMSDVDSTMSGAGRSWVQSACEASLSRLGTDYIDLYQLHVPDPDTPIAETLGALQELVDQGKARVVGCSNFSLEQLSEADDTARASGLARFETVQNELSLLVKGAEEGVLPFCSEAGIAFLPYFPLASGLLTGKYRMGQDPPSESRHRGPPGRTSTPRAR